MAIEIVQKRGRDDIALIYIARLRGDDRSTVEFVDATDGGIPRSKKWVVNVSTQFGCPVGCAMCDAGTHYFGNLTADEMLAQVDHVVSTRQPDKNVRTDKFKVHFARMGEPALNLAVLDALAALPGRFTTPNLIAAVATTAPKSASAFFDRLIDIKNDLYAGGHFQLQFSINSTDERVRDRLMPVPKWTMADIANYGRRFWRPGDRRIVLNLAVADETPIDCDVLARTFDTERFMVKLTPMNPTASSRTAGLKTALSADRPDGVDGIARRLDGSGFNVVVSIGSPQEDEIGSNCGEAVRDWREGLARTRAKAPA